MVSLNKLLLFFLRIFLVIALSKMKRRYCRHIFLDQKYTKYIFNCSYDDRGMLFHR